MTLQDARKLCWEIRGKSYHCIVPLGFGPDGYFARIFGSEHVIDFRTRAAFRAHHAMRLRQRRALARELAAPQKRRSPIEIMVDRACGLEKP